MPDMLIGFTEADLLAQLPRPVRESIAALEADNSKWDDVGAVLASGPTAGISLKGGGHWSGALWQNVKKEFHSFLCSDSSTYADLRKEWDSLRQKSSALAVASLSGLIGSQLGVASGVIAPLVIWAAVVVLRIGKEAACAAMTPPPPPSA